MFGVVVRATIGLCLAGSSAVITGCGGSSDSPSPSVECVEGSPEVTLTTDDSVELIADFHMTGEIGAPAVMLLHMIPPSNDKSNYGGGFIGPLVAEGFHVLNINRRGAPGSGGVATEAYTGPNGKLDAKAGYDFLVASACSVPPTGIAVVGASNGTTTAVDFSVFAATASDVRQPAAMVFLSGGTYTEAQHRITDERSALEAHPVYVAYPSSEASWNQGIEMAGLSGWTFAEYSPGGHGTNLLSANPDTITDVVRFLASAL